jgi:hypothetical protein
VWVKISPKGERRMVFVDGHELNLKRLDEIKANGIIW